MTALSQQLLLAQYPIVHKTEWRGGLPNVLQTFVYFFQSASAAMSTGKRLAKRSILGTRVAAPAGEGLYLTGIIQAVKTCEDPSLANRFSVRFDDNPANVSEFLEGDLIGPGFKTVTCARLHAGQLVYVTHNQREMAGRVVRHDFDSQDVIITLSDVSLLFYLQGTL